MDYILPCDWPQVAETFVDGFQLALDLYSNKLLTPTCYSRKVHEGVWEINELADRYFTKLSRSEAFEVPRNAIEESPC